MATNTVFASGAREELNPPMSAAFSPIPILPELQAAKSSLEKLLAALPPCHHRRPAFLKALAKLNAEIACAGRH